MRVRFALLLFYVVLGCKLSTAQLGVVPSGQRELQNANNLEKERLKTAINEISLTNFAQSPKRPTNPSACDPHAALYFFETVLYFLVEK